VDDRARWLVPGGARTSPRHRRGRTSTARRANVLDGLTRVSIEGSRGGRRRTARPLDQPAVASGRNSVDRRAVGRAVALERPVPKAETMRFANQVAHRTTAMERSSALGPSEKPSISLPAQIALARLTAAMRKMVAGRWAGSLAIERPTSAEISPINSKRANAGNRHGGKRSLLRPARWTCQRHDHERCRRQPASPVVTHDATLQPGHL
jgi:hypothetical protein